MKDKLPPNISNEELTQYFFNKYSKTNEAIDVSFRALFPELNKADRFSHLIHSYPAKLLVHIPYFFLNNSIFSKENDLILDPFCGTGTVLLEANIAGRNAIGADANPLARMIAEVKTQKLESSILVEYLDKLLHRSKQFRKVDFPHIENIDFWFPLKNKIQLAKIYRAISEISDPKYKSFFELCFSNCIKKVSYADPRIAVPVKLNPNRFAKDSISNQKITKRLFELENLNVFNRFNSICSDNIIRINSLNSIDPKVNSQIISKNAQVLTKSLNESSLLEDESIQFILTSPPYAGAQKYIRSSSLNLGWLGLTKHENLKSLDSKNIGRENYLLSEIKEIKTGITNADKLIEKLFKINKLRAHIVGNYLIEMKIALAETIRVLKKGGYLVIVIGNNKVCNFEFNTQEYLSEYLETEGLNLQFKLIDDIKSYGLMTKRNKTADIISREWILVFKK